MIEENKMWHITYMTFQSHNSLLEKNHIKTLFLLNNHIFVKAKSIIEDYELTEKPKYR